MSDNYSVRTGDGTLITKAAKDIGSAIFASSSVVVDASGNVMPSGDTAARASNVIVGNGTITLGVFAEDAVHTSGDKGLLVLAVRADTAASTADTTGDYAALTTDASGRLWQIGASDGPATAGTVASKSALIGAQFLAFASLPALTTAQQVALQCDLAGTLKVGPVPLGVSLVDSHTGAATALNCTLAKSAGKMTYLQGFAVSGLGATAAGSIQITTTGLVSELTFTLPIPAGVTVGVTPLIVTFNPPIPASGANVDVVLNVPSFGGGSTVASASAWGYKI